MTRSRRRSTPRPASPGGAKEPLRMRLAVAAGKFFAGVFVGLMTAGCGVRGIGIGGVFAHAAGWVGVVAWVLGCGVAGVLFAERFFGWINDRIEGDWGR